MRAECRLRRHSGIRSLRRLELHLAHGSVLPTAYLRHVHVSASICAPNPNRHYVLLRLLVAASLAAKFRARYHIVGAVATSHVYGQLLLLALAALHVLDAAVVPGAGTEGICVCVCFLCLAVPGRWGSYFLSA